MSLPSHIVCITALVPILTSFAKIYKLLFIEKPSDEDAAKECEYFLENFAMWFPKHSMSRIRSLRRDIVPENAFYGSGTSVWVEFGQNLTEI